MSRITWALIRTDPSVFMVDHEGQDVSRDDVLNEKEYHRCLMIVSNPEGKQTRVIALTAYPNGQAVPVDYLREVYRSFSSDRTDVVSLDDADSFFALEVVGHDA